jgi:hypothetical protein
MSFNRGGQRGPPRHAAGASREWRSPLAHPLNTMNDQKIEEEVEKINKLDEEEKQYQWEIWYIANEIQKLCMKVWMTTLLIYIAAYLSALSREATFQPWVVLLYFSILTTCIITKFSSSSIAKIIYKMGWRVVKERNVT